MDVSVIVCTYNPDKKIFGKCLNALAKLKSSEVSFEVLVIDNNSNPALETVDYVKSFLSLNSNFRLVRESKPGLTYARIAGIKNSTGGICIFIDDDNEPDENYISEAWKIGQENLDKGAWGPGTINVVYQDGYPKWADRFKKQFQQKNFHTIRSTTSPTRNRMYPVGTGLVVRKNILEEYVHFIESKSTVVKDRTAGSLTSGGDLQITLLAVKMGYSVGTFPNLSLNHLIPNSRLNMKYMKKRIYGCAISYNEALLGILPDYKPEMIKQIPTPFQILKTLLKFIIKKNFKLFSKESQIEFADLLGMINGYLFLENKTDSFSRKLARILKLE